MDGSIPPPPEGYVMQPDASGASSVPPPPPGYQIQPDASQTQEPSTFQKINQFGNDMGDAFVHHLANLPIGVAQSVAHQYKALIDAAAPAKQQTVGGLISGQAPQVDPNASWMTKERAKLAGYVDTGVNALDTAIRNRETNYQQAVPTNAASLTGATLGEALPFAFEAPVKGLGMVGEAVGNLVSRAGPLAAKIASGATQGALIGAAQPATGTGSVGSQKLAQAAGGAVLGGAIPAAGRVVSEVGNLGKAVLNPKAVASQNIARLVGSDPATLAKLDAASSGNISGVMPTTAQAAPSPSAVAAEKTLGNQPGYKEMLVQRQNDNNAARLAVIQQHAGDEAAMQAAKDVRSAATQPFIQQHLQPATPATRWSAAQQSIDDALSKPMVRDDNYRALTEAKSIIQKVKNGSMQEDDAMEAMKELEQSASSPKVQSAFAGAFDAVNHNMIDPSKVLQAAALTRNTGLGARPAVRDALDRITATINQSKNINGLVPADVMDSIRQNINDFLVSPTGKRATPQEALGVAPIRDQIVQTVGQHAPGYSDYLAAYAKHSEPINTMRANQAILDRVGTRSLNSVGASPLSLNDINQGLKTIEKGRYGVSPQAQKDLEAVQQSLKQEGISNSIRSPGSDTAYNINAQGLLTKNLLGPNFGGPTGKTRVGAAAIGALLGEHFGGLEGGVAGAGLGAFINKASDVVNKRIMDQYAKGLLNPADAATMIRAYLKGNPTKASMLLARYPQWNALISAGNQMTKPQKANP